ncbi:MAG: TIGR01777 family oxidoreductase [Flavobacteriales bacterium]
MTAHADSPSSRSLSTVLVTGASGLVGRSVVRRLHEEYPLAKIHILGRNASGVHWNPDLGHLDQRALLGVDGLVHLAGETVAQRWTSSVKARIRSSRIDSLALIEAICREHGLAPRVVSASAIGWYPSGDSVQDESMPAATDFLAEVVQDWEAGAAALGSRGGGHVSLRIGLVLSAHGGVLGKLVPLYRRGLGSPLAPGTQWQSWIHVDDLTDMILQGLSDTAWEGSVNAVSPNPVAQREFSRTLARVLRRPHVLPAVPRFAIQLLYGEAAHALLASHRITPARALDSGFAFRHPNLEEAVRHLLT